MALQVGSAYLEVKLNPQKFGSEHGVRRAHIEGNGQREATPPIYANGGTGVVTTGSIMISRSSPNENLASHSGECQRAGGHDGKEGGARRTSSRSELRREWSLSRRIWAWRSVHVVTINELLQVLLCDSGLHV